ncbi:MAG: cytochrome C oxidase subunit IV family protein [Planctomycetota bacterium]|nr:cytochrome C oxidase subunit IV family protein [Planctomycetota bacterium]
MSAHGHSEDGHDFAHPLPVPMLLAVFGALVFLTIVTVAQASFDFGKYDVAIVMVIATIKAGLVMAFFMHMAFDKPFNVIVFLSSFVFVGLFVIFTLSDSAMTSESFEPKIDDVVPAVAEM